MQRRVAFAVPALLSAAVLMAGVAVAQDLPSGEELMDKSSMASGGEAMLEELQTVTVEGTMNIKNMGMAGEVSMYMAQPDKAYMVFELPGLEKLQRGWNGEVGWEMSIMQGPRLLTGSELASFLRDVDFQAQLDWRRMYKSAKTTGEKEVEGRPCYVVDLVTQTDEAMTVFLDQETYLPAGMEMTAKTQYGEITAEVIFKEYKSFKGMMMPVVTETVAAGQTMVLTIDSVKLNEAIDESIFELPPDIQALVDAQQGVEETP
jgi:hypothetical protein